MSSDEGNDLNIFIKVNKTVFILFILLIILLSLMTVEGFIGGNFVDGVSYRCSFPASVDYEDVSFCFIWFKFAPAMNSSSERVKEEIKNIFGN